MVPPIPPIQANPVQADPSLAVLLRDAGLKRYLSKWALQAGQDYADAGRVRNLQLEPDGRSLTAEVQGSDRTPYRQRIIFTPTRLGGLGLYGQCTCPVGSNCKHVAAAVLTLRAGMHRPPSGGTQMPLRSGTQMPLRGGTQMPFSASPAPIPAPVEIPAPLAAWLDRLQARGQADAPAPPKIVVAYILRMQPVPDGGALLKVEAVQRQIRKNGTPGGPRPVRSHQISQLSDHVAAADRLVLRRLDRLTYEPNGLAADDDPPDLLRRILGSGQARWNCADGQPASEGPPRQATLVWQAGPEGSQLPGLKLDEGLARLRLGVPWYAEPAKGLLGPLDADLPTPLLAALLSAPPVPAEFAPRVAEALARHAPAAPAPLRLDPPEPVGGPPVPRLVLTRAVVPRPRPHDWRRPPQPPEMRDLPVARLSFDYGPINLAPPMVHQPRIHRAGDKLFRVTRDGRAEDAAAMRLTDAGLIQASEGLSFQHPQRPPPGDYILSEAPDAPDWLAVLAEEIPALEAEGWRIETLPDFPLRMIEPEGDFAARLTESSGIDWFELELGVMVDGAWLDLVPPLLRLIRRQGGATLVPVGATRPLLVPLPDGRVLRLPIERIRPTLAALEDVLAGAGPDGSEDSIRFARLDAPALAEFEATAGLRFEGGEALRTLGRRLREAGGAIPPAAIPASFQGTLRAYQQQGVGWMQMLRDAGLGGVLADDMGLGKTVQTLGHLAIEKAAGRLDRPALIVCPTSVLPNWQREARRFAPDLALLALHGPGRKRVFSAIGAQDLVLTSYPLLARDAEVLTEQDWSVVVLDEAQVIRNPKAETTRQAQRLKAGQRLCLSGTPLQNHLGDLWSLFHFLAPGFLGTEKDFRARYRTPIEKQGNTDRQAALVRRVRPFLLRRTKAEVVDDLPPKTEIIEDVVMEPAQRAIYEGIRLAMHARVKAAIVERGLARSGIVILDALLKLRQACCDPRLLKLPAVKAAKAGSAKLDRLMDLLDTLREEGRRVLVFSQFTTMLALIEDRLRAADIGYLTLTGQTKDRDTPVRRFQAGEMPVFLISLKAGGVGLNLTAADTVIHYDPWWNPAAEDQATDRAHRIGQDRAVFVHRLVTQGSIEEKMEVLKGRKRALVEAVLAAEGGGALRLAEEDIEALFAPG